MIKPIYTFVTTPAVFAEFANLDKAVARTNVINLSNGFVLNVQVP